MNTLAQSELLSYIIASILGTIFHFVYDLSGENYILGLFFPINESTWEHLKLIFFPILIMSVIEYLFLNVKTDNFACAKLVSALIGMGSTIAMFYTFNGVYGRNVEWVNILIYFIAMGFAYSYSYRKIAASCSDTHALSPKVCIILFTVIILMFMIFSVNPPDIGLFADPRLAR